MLARVISAATLGVEAYEVEVEADIQQQLPAFVTVGLPDGAVRESKERVTAARMIAEQGHEIVIIDQEFGFHLSVQADHDQPGPGGHQEGRVGF